MTYHQWHPQWHILSQIAHRIVLLMVTRQGDLQGINISTGVDCWTANWFIYLWPGWPQCMQMDLIKYQNFQHFSGRNISSSLYVQTGQRFSEFAGVYHTWNYIVIKAVSLIWHFAWELSKIQKPRSSIYLHTAQDVLVHWCNQLHVILTFFYIFPWKFTFVQIQMDVFCK